MTLSKDSPSSLIKWIAFAASSASVGLAWIGMIAEQCARHEAVGGAFQINEDEL